MRKIAVLALMAGFLLSILPPLSAAQSQTSPPQKKEEKVFIPKEVKTVMEAGLMNKQSRQDIPFTITGNLYMPGVGAFHNVFSLDIMNADLGFSPVPAPTAETEKSKPAQKTEAPAAAPAPAPDLQANFDIFLQIRDIAGGLPGLVVRESYVPYQERVPAADYDPNKTETYFLRYPLPAGKYLVAMALTTTDLKKMGIQYYEFNLPDPASFTDKLGLTPVFSSKDIETMETPETRIVLSRGFFTMGALKFIPNINNVIGVKDIFDVFFYVFGARLNVEQKYALEITVEVKKGEDTVIRFKPTVFDSPVFHLPLPMKYSVVKQTEAGEVREDKNLEPGQYVLVMKIVDQNSGNTLTKNVDFEVK